MFKVIVVTLISRAERKKLKIGVLEEEQKRFSGGENLFMSICQVSERSNSRLLRKERLQQHGLW